MKPDLIILINPVSLHKDFCQALTKAGIKIIALYSTVQGNEYFAIGKEYFSLVENLSTNFANDLQRIKEIIKDYHLISALPAYETDFEYAEKIAYALCPDIANNPADAFLRYKKYEMNEALRQAGINAIAQLRLGPQQKLSDIGNLQFPIIVKPSFESGGGVGVKSCENITEVIEHVNLLQQGFTFKGTVYKTDIVIQEKIEGVEYFTDTVSINDSHSVIGIYKYKKISINGSPIYRYIQFIPPSHSIWQICYDYTLKVLDVLKVKHGFAHIEFIVTDANQPYLIELNPRLSGLGGEINRLSRLIFGYDQTDVYIRLIQQDKLPESKTPKNIAGRIVFLFSWENTTFTGFNSDLLQQLKSKQIYYRLFKPLGSLLTPPQNLLDIVMTVILIDENIEHIVADTECLQRLEQEGELFNG